MVREGRKIGVIGMNLETGEAGEEPGRKQCEVKDPRGARGRVPRGRVGACAAQVAGGAPVGDHQAGAKAKVVHKGTAVGIGRCGTARCTGQRHFRVRISIEKVGERGSSAAKVRSKHVRVVLTVAQVCVEITHQQHLVTRGDGAGKVVKKALKRFGRGIAGGRGR
jgi:hypothetical protein